MGRDVQVDYQRYANLIASEIKPSNSPFVPQVESDTAVQVERATVYPDALLRPDRLDPILRSVDRLIRLVAEGNLAAVAVVDRSGQHRPVYRPLLIYGWLQAFKLLYEELPRDQFGRWD